MYKLDDMEFGRRLAGERVLMKSAQQNCLNAGKLFALLDVMNV